MIQLALCKGIRISKTTLKNGCIAVGIFGVTGCRPSPQDVGAKVQMSMQRTFDTEAQFRSNNPKVAKIVLVRDHDNSYQGIVTVVSSGQPHDISITVVADEENLIWKAEPAALLALSLPVSQKSPFNKTEDTILTDDDVSSAQAESSNFEDRAIKLVKMDYMLKANQPDEIRQGKWYSSRIGQPDGQFINVVVDYVVPSRGTGCRWTISFPVARPSVYSVSTDAKVKQFFVEVPMGQPTKD